MIVCASESFENLHVPIKLLWKLNIKLYIAKVVTARFDWCFEIFKYVWTEEMK